MGSTHYSKRIPERKSVRRPRNRPKTFKSEEAAKAWAEKKGIASYDLKNLRSPEGKTKKIQVIRK